MRGRSITGWEKHAAGSKAVLTGCGFAVGLGAAGLGFSDQQQQQVHRPSQAGASYDTYRQMRSGHYHESLHKAAAMKLGG